MFAAGHARAYGRGSRLQDACLYARATIQAGQGPPGIAVSPLVVSGVQLPMSENQCKHGGWKAFGTTFKNQGDCVTFVATSGKNPPRGA